MERLARLVQAGANGPLRGLFSDWAGCAYYGWHINRKTRDGDGLLHLAVQLDAQTVGKECQLSVVDTLLDHGATIDIRNRAGLTPFMLAALHGRELVVERLLECGASLDAVDRDGRNVLALLFDKGDIGMVIRLFELGADPALVCDPYGRTSLHMAAIQGDWRAVHALKTCYQRAMPRKPQGLMGTQCRTSRCFQIQDDTGSTALHCAAENGHAEVIAKLAEGCSDWLLCDMHDHTAYEVALHRRHDVVRRVMVEAAGAQLLKMCMDFSKYDLLPHLLADGLDRRMRVGSLGVTPLHAAVFSCDATVIQRVMAFYTQSEIKVVKTSKGALTAVHLAVIKGYACSVRALLACGATVHCQDSRGYTPLMDALERGLDDIVRILVDNTHKPATALTLQQLVVLNMPRVLCDLLEYGVDADLPNANGTTPLVQAIIHGRSGPAKALLRRGADPHQVTQLGNRVLPMAASRRHLAIVRALLDHGADIDGLSPVNGGNALMSAAALGHYEVVNCLLMRGASAHVVHKDGWTAAGAAARGTYHKEIVNLLLSHVAEPGMIDLPVTPPGRTLLMVAAAQGNDVAVEELLVVHGASLMVRDKDGHTAKHIAAGMGYPETAHTLETLETYDLDRTRALLEGASVIRAVTKSNAVLLDRFSAPISVRAATTFLSSRMEKGLGLPRAYAELPTPAGMCGGRDVAAAVVHSALTSLNDDLFTTLTGIMTS